MHHIELRFFQLSLVEIYAVGDGNTTKFTLHQIRHRQPSALIAATLLLSNDNFRHLILPTELVKIVRRGQQFIGINSTVWVVGDATNNTYFKRAHVALVLIEKIGCKI